MKSPCDVFRAELERLVAASDAGLEALGRSEHALACAACRSAWSAELGLERLLVAVPPPAVPVGLAARVLAGLERRRADAALDALLEQVPPPAVPPGLARRVLAGVAPARRPRRRLGVWLAAAAVLLVGLALWTWRTVPVPVESLELAAGELEADPDLIAYAVEQWEVLHDEDIDVWLASLDPLDELLLEVAADGELWPEDEGLGAPEAPARGARED